MRNMQFAAIILAAGYSSRMGKFKPLLAMGDETVLDRTISTFRHKFISDIIVVVGHNHEKIVSRLTNQNVSVVENPNYQTGMFSSIQTGVSRLSSSIDAFFIMPVDIPLVAPATINHLADAHKEKPDHIIRPQYQGRFGHPPLLPSRLIAPILKFAGKGGLREILQEHRGITVRLPVTDPNILKDLDYPEDFQEALKKYQSGS